MNEEMLFEAIGGVEDSLLLASDKTWNSEEGKANMFSKKLVRLGTLAASVCIIITALAGYVVRMGYLNMGCSTDAGIIVDGTYYYDVAHDGVYAYTPKEGCRKIISSFWIDSWMVNETGFFYERGKSLYGIFDGKTKGKRIYKAGFLECSDMDYWFSGEKEMTVALFKRNLKGERISAKENLIELNKDGISVKTDGWEDFDTWYVRYEKQFEESEAEEALREKLGGTYAKSGGFYYSVNKDQNAVICTEAETMEQWELKNGKESVNFYSVATDGDYLYSCAPWEDFHICWKIKYDDAGRPEGLNLVEDIDVK